MGTFYMETFFQCAESFNICGPRGICVNDAGSFHCECKRGYRLNDEGTGCEDVDECGLGKILTPISYAL